MTRELWHDHADRIVQDAIDKHGPKPTSETIGGPPTWRPMSTMPDEYRDGRCVLICDVDGQPHSLQWEKVAWRGDNGHYLWDTENEGNKIKATHWSPIPVMPETAVFPDSENSKENE